MALGSRGRWPKQFHATWAVVKVAMEIIGEAYKERLDNWNAPDKGTSAEIVARALPAFAGMMYVQNGGNLTLAKVLFRDMRVFAPAAGYRSFVIPVDTAVTLYNEAPRRALEDFLYIQYQNGEDNALANIKRNDPPELAKIVDEVGRRYGDDVNKMLDRVRAAKSKAKPSSPKHVGGEAEPGAALDAAAEND